jgi:hypothetical protein
MQPQCSQHTGKNMRGQYCICACSYCDLLKANINQYGGFGKVTALMSDREAVCVRTSIDLQEEHPHLMLTWCQGHGEHAHIVVGSLQTL